jgi:hypothetical protein
VRLVLEEGKTITLPRFCRDQTRCHRLLVQEIVERGW